MSKDAIREAVVDLAVAMNTAQLTPEEFYLGHDLTKPAERLLAAIFANRKALLAVLLPVEELAAAMYEEMPGYPRPSWQWLTEQEKAVRRPDAVAIIRRLTEGSGT